MKCNYNKIYETLLTKTTEDFKMKKTLNNSGLTLINENEYIIGNYDFFYYSDVIRDDVVQWNRAGKLICVLNFERRFMYTIYPCEKDFKRLSKCIDALKTIPTSNYVPNLNDDKLLLTTTVTLALSNVHYITESMLHNMVIIIK